VCSGLAHRTVSGAPGPYRVQQATLEFQHVHSAINNQTVRCASGATTTSRNDRLQKYLTRGTVRGRVRAQSQRHTGQ
jgi:inosine/xanthosine triphosphate pyrophosphatase family protein